MFVADQLGGALRHLFFKCFRYFCDIFPRCIYLFWIWGAFEAGIGRFMQKQAWGSEQILKVMPKMTENRPAKFGKKAARNSGHAFSKFCGTVLVTFQRHLNGSSRTQRMFFHKVSDAVLKTHKEIFKLRSFLEKVRRKFPQNQKKMS